VPPHHRIDTQMVYDAISAQIVHWDGRALGVSYSFPDGDREARLIGTEDTAALARLESEGKLTYVDEEARERYQAMKRTGIFGDR
jgi:hypothetical protein